MLGLLLVPGRGAVVREPDADVVCEPGPSGSSLVRCGGSLVVAGGACMDAGPRFTVSAGPFGRAQNSMSVIG